jgi:hypothetical protein
VRFDAYAGNVRSGVCAAELSETVARGSDARVSRGRPRGRYSDVFELADGSLPVGWIGLDQQLDAIYFEFKGERTPQASASIRKWFPSHTVSRFDSCEDFDAPGAFKQIVGIMDDAKDPRVQSLAMTPRDGDRGETIYFGSTSSRAMVRCYEAGKMKDRLHFGRPHWARAEAQIRPGKSAEKALAARLSPVQAWGFAAWTKRAAEVLCQVEVERFAPQTVPGSFDRTSLYLARAFRRHLTEQLELFGDWECIGREIEAIWALDDKVEAELAEGVKVARRATEPRGRNE